MKKNILFLALGCIASLNVNAQTVVNPGFEGQFLEVIPDYFM